MTNDSVKRQFNEAAARYDGERSGLIPCYDDFYGMAVSWAETDKSAPRILDLGAGTGLFASLAKRKYPEGMFTLIDLSPNMIESARSRFRDDPSVTCIVADYTQYDFGESYDLVISSLSIHHLPHPDKQALFAKIRGLLAPGGMFVNADQASGTNGAFDRRFKERWEASVAGSGLPAEAIASSKARRELDVNAPVAEQLEWLRAAGFAEADCVYKYNEFAVFAAYA
ncbi:class I SAM-dependent methyltransferase [Paenibacillus hodogayensis]|uniref:Class I SAM-dependent methyltransferase n=1 Tax=Paenibacillus hodogayensis TaxID=279208 RepID=A0ABV5VVC9_9BACL